MGFGLRGVHGFDITLTDGKEFSQPSRVTGDPGEAREVLGRVYLSLGIGLIYGKPPEGIRGVSMGGRVVLRPGMPW